VSGHTVKTHTYVIVFNTRGGAPTMGTYHDTLVKTNGKWLIQKREVWRPGEVKKDPRCPTDLNALELNRIRRRRIRDRTLDRPTYAGVPRDFVA